MTRARATAELALAALLFAVMALATKHATRSLGAGQIAMLRFVGGVLFVWGHATLARRPLRFVRKDALVMRGVFGGLAVLLYFLSLAHLPVGTATLLNYSSPMFVVAFTAIFLGEEIVPRHLVALAVAAAGVVLVIVGQGKALGGAYGWMLVGLASAVLSGGAITSIRVARRTDGAREIFGSFCLIGIACTAPVALFDWQTPDAHGWVLLAVIISTSIAAQMLMTHAVAAVDAAVGGVLSQLAVVFATLLGILVDNEPVMALSLAGALLTVGGASVLHLGAVRR